MITEEYIRELTNTTFFQRGKSIQGSDWKIEEFLVSEAGDKDYISAQVAGSRGNHYYVTGEYDYTDQEVYEMTCECPRITVIMGCANTVSRYCWNIWNIVKEEKLSRIIWEITAGIK